MFSRHLAWWGNAGWGYPDKTHQFSFYIWVKFPSEDILIFTKLDINWINVPTWVLEGGDTTTKVFVWGLENSQINALLARSMNKGHRDQAPIGLLKTFGDLLRTLKNVKNSLSLKDLASDPIRTFWNSNGNHMGTLGMTVKWSRVI